jgi:hypothetical protein
MLETKRETPASGPIVSLSKHSGTAGKNHPNRLGVPRARRTLDHQDEVTGAGYLDQRPSHQGDSVAGGEDGEVPATSGQGTGPSHFHMEESLDRQDL